MRNKLLSVLILLILSSTGIFGIVSKQGNYTVNTQGFEIQAGYDEFASIRVHPIAAQTLGYLVGMPFNIEDSQVAYNENSSGRVIATWDVLANKAFTITAECPDLTHDEDVSVSLPYQLTFEYKMSYSPDGVTDESVDGKWVCNSGTAPQVFKVSESEKIENVDSAFFVGSVSGNIYFQFRQYMNDNTSVKDAIKAAPGGDYGANVVLKIAPED